MTVVTGSIATDYLMVFPDRFLDQFVDGQLDNISHFDLNQIASFYSGVMGDAREIELAGLVDGIDLVMVSPNDPAAMVRHAQECRDRGDPFAAVVSQQVARRNGPEIRPLVEGARYLVTNAYERSLLEQKTGWASDEVLARAGAAVTTLVLETVGTQEYTLDPDDVLVRVKDAYGSAAAAETAVRLGAVTKEPQS